MFYWNYKDIFVVLTYEEMMTLVNELSENAREPIGFLIDKQTHKHYTKKIFVYLKTLMLSDWETFESKYYYKVGYGDDAQNLFPILLDAYGRATKRATIGKYGNAIENKNTQQQIVSKMNALFDDLLYEQKDIYYITLLGRRSLPWSKIVPLGYFSLPIKAINRVEGTVTNFFVETSKGIFNFNRDFICFRMAFD